MVSFLLRLDLKTGEFRDFYKITSRGATFWEVLNASSGKLKHASGAILTADDVAGDLIVPSRESRSTGLCVTPELHGRAIREQKEKGVSTLYRKRES